jgi:hypothetical protein
LIPTEEYVTPDTRLWRVGDADETEAKIRSPNDMRDNIGETLWWARSLHRIIYAA